MPRFNIKEMVSAFQAIPKDMQLAYGAVAAGVLLILIALILW